MNNSFENFQSRFIDEALDNIADLERALMALELSPNEKELVERVFRAMHSLKGGGAMFGFERLSEFTHRLENIYELVRAGQLCISSELLSVTLQSVDLLRDLLEEPGSNLSAPLKKRYKAMEKKIDAVVKLETEKMLTKRESCNSGNDMDKQDSEEGLATYFIHFYPDKDVPANGTNLLYLLDDLKELGQMYAVPGVQNIPVFSDLTVERSHVFWDIFLATEKSINEIRDVFIFVEDNAVFEIHRISRSNLFQSKEFTDKMEELSERQKKIDLSEVTNLVRNSNVVTNEEQKQANVFENQKTSNETSFGLEEHPSSGDKENGKRRVNGSIRVDTDKIDNLMNLVSEMVITQERLNMIASHYQIPELKLVSETVQKLTSQLRDSTFSISLIPLETLQMRFQRLVYDLSSKLGEKIVLQTSGLETELDKTMIENLTDPILHILRNSIDHGIENPELRRKKGKSEEGTIQMNAFYSGANVVIEIIDDGAGIDTQKVYASAVKKGIVSENEDLSEKEILNLVFQSGFSTNHEITEVSGRGVGMDVVMRNIQSIRGMVDIASEKEKGTTITITLPLVLSIIDGLLVRINKTQYVIPLSLIDHIFPVKRAEIESSFNNIISLGGKQMSFFNLRQELEEEGDAPERMQMVIVSYHDTKIALAVDYVIGKLQAVLKPLGKMYHDQALISAATIMGDGSIALVLDVNALVNECSEKQTGNN